MPRKYANALREIHPSCTDWMQHSPIVRDTLNRPDAGPMWAKRFRDLLTYAQYGEEPFPGWKPVFAAHLLELERCALAGSEFNDWPPPVYNDTPYFATIAAVRARNAIERGHPVPRYWLWHLAGCHQSTVLAAVRRGALRCVNAGKSAGEEARSHRPEIDSESARSWLASRGVVVARLELTAPCLR